MGLSILLNLRKVICHSREIGNLNKGNPRFREDDISP